MSFLVTGGQIMSLRISGLNDNNQTCKNYNNMTEKAQYFAHYWGQNVLYRDDYAPDRSHLVGLGVDLDWEGWYLKLMPLFNIGEEDRNEAARILQVYPEDLMDWLNGDCTHEDFHTPFQFIPVIDYLKSKGYAIPWRDKSVDRLIKLGWLKLTS